MQASHCPNKPFCAIARLKPRSGLVSYSSIIWYGYSQAIAESAPKPDDPSKKLRAILSKMYPERPDLWVGGSSRIESSRLHRHRHLTVALVRAREADMTPWITHDDTVR